MDFFVALANKGQDFVKHSNQTTSVLVGLAIGCLTYVWWTWHAKSERPVEYNAPVPEQCRSGWKGEQLKELSLKVSERLIGGKKRYCEHSPSKDSGFLVSCLFSFFVSLHCRRWHTFLLRLMSLDTRLDGCTVLLSCYGSIAGSREPYHTGWNR